MIKVCFALCLTACTVEPPSTGELDHDVSGPLYLGYTCTTVGGFTMCQYRLPDGSIAYFDSQAQCERSLPATPPTPILGEGPTLSCSCIASVSVPGTWIHTCTGGKAIEDIDVTAAGAE